MTLAGSIMPITNMVIVRARMVSLRPESDSLDALLSVKLAISLETAVSSVAELIMILPREIYTLWRFGLGSD